MQKSNKIIGILLAGGLSQRFGSPKAFAEIDGKKYYEITYDVLESICDEVVIVTRAEYVDAFPKSYHVIVDKDPFKGCGPLAGIYSAMEAVCGDAYVCLPCDMPLMNEQVMKRLMKFHKKNITVVRSEGQLQPLVSVWSPAMKAKIYESLTSEIYKMTNVLDHAEVNEIDGKRLSDSSHVFMNVNTIENEKEMMEWKRL